MGLEADQEDFSGEGYSFRKGFGQTGGGRGAHRTRRRQGDLLRGNTRQHIGEPVAALLRG